MTRHAILPHPFEPLRSFLAYATGDERPKLRPDWAHIGEEKMAEKHLAQPRTSPGMQETIDQMHELSGVRKPDIMAKLFAAKPRFTPGPWQVMNEYDGATIVIANVDGETFSDGTSTFSYDFVCDTLPDDGDGSRSREIAVANARLIAAAPDLLEALRKVAAEVGGLRVFESEIRAEIGNTNWNVLMLRLSEADAALAKAEGK